MSSDKFFIWIVIGVVLIVAATFIVVLLQPEGTYKEDGTPESIVHNYLLALEKGDYARALGYFSETLAYPPSDAENFAEHIDHSKCYWAFRDLERDLSIFVQPARITGDLAKVTVQQTIYNRDGLFGGGDTQDDFQMTLKLEDEEWKLVSGGEYWCECWSEKNSRCPGQ